MNKKEKIDYFQNNILAWFKLNGREFIWRNKNQDAYSIILAEILLQRTKAETVSKYFESFKLKYPSWDIINRKNIKNLEKSLLPFGLYKQRAKRIKELASYMVKNDDLLPKTLKELRELPLFGQYISNAIFQYIYNKPAPLLDVNMARVLERFFGPRKLADIRYDPYLQELAQIIVNHKMSKKINWAILDYAALVCTKRDPKCEKCILIMKCKHFKIRYK